MRPIHRHPNDLGCVFTDDLGAEIEERHRNSHRRCLASGAVLPKGALLRFVVGQDGVLVFDADERLPGPGCWIKAERALLEHAFRRRLFAKAAKQHVEAPSPLVDHVALRLRQRCLNAIGLARRAGRCVVGHGKTTKALERPDTSIVLIAADGSDGERAKLCARVVGLNLVDDFMAAELGAALGRPRVVYGSIQQGRLAANLLRDVNRLRGVDRVDGKKDCQASLVSTNAITDL